MPLVQLQNAHLAFGHVPLLEDVNLIIKARERVCLIGRNGTGKSTLLNVLNGQQVLDSGTLRIDSGVKVAKLAQEVPAAATATLYDTVAAGLGDLSGLLSRYHHLSHEVATGDAQTLEALSTVQAEIDQIGAWDASQRVDAILSRLKLPADSLMAECSGGIRRRAMLGQALVGEPDLLLLDEPTNHLDIDSITALEAALLTYSGAVLFITHDRTFIDDLATRIIELDRGTLNSYPGTHAEYLKQKNAELAAEAEGNRKFDQQLAEEEVWIRTGIKARRTRNEGRVRRLEAMRLERKARLERQGSVKLSLDSSADSGKIVIEADKVSFSFDDQPILREFSTTILRGDRVGIIGPNGSGKSTLLKLLLGELEPSSGSVQQGTKLQIAYFDQERIQLQPERSVRDNVADGTDQIEIAGKSRHVISYLRDFLFAPERVNSPVKTLSGGERNRLLLAKLFAKPANLLVLDEPTNDLDVETLELLEELLSGFDGTLLLVSHDRAFLDQTVTSTLVLEGDGRIGEYVGGYSDWKRQADTKRKTEAEARPNKPRDSRKPAKPARTSGRQNGLSGKEKRELDALPGRIEELEEKQAALTEETAEADFYQQDRERVEAALQSLADVTNELEQAYQRWSELEDAQ